MSDLFWPGDERAGDLFTPRAFLEAMIAVEEAWLAGLASAGIAPPDAAVSLKVRVDDGDVETIARAAEAVGNPVVALLRLLRGHLPTGGAAAQWLHRGLTSQDVVDTALMMCGRDTLDQVLTELSDQVTALRRLALEHRDTLMAGRTLAQFAVPTTFGLKAATWLQGVLDAGETVQQVRAGLRSQFGGAAGTMAATCDLAQRAGLPDPVQRAERAVAEASRLLGLASSPPWHTSRAPITRLADALTGCTDAWGHIATDVITLSRPEIAEVSEPGGAGRGASSTMPQKRNPVLSILIRRAGLSAPMAAAQVHLAAADTGDERPAGAWHLEWLAVQTLARHTVVAASQLTEVLAGLQVHADQMSLTLTGAVPGILAERLASRRASRLAEADDRLPGDELSELLDPAGYLGTASATIDAILARADIIFPGEHS